VEKLEKWVSKNPEAADAPTINMTTGKEFTVRGVLEQLKQEKVSGAKIVDPTIIEVKDQIKKWLE
jgi:hypothetical protein